MKTKDPPRHLSSEKGLSEGTGHRFIFSAHSLVELYFLGYQTTKPYIGQTIMRPLLSGNMSFHQAV